MDLRGIGPSGAARLPVEVGDITRFPDRNHFASWNGTTPIDASSGDQVRHRLSPAENRQINRALHIMATVQLRHQTMGRAYIDRKKAAGKTPNQAMRCLKRRLSDIVYQHMADDALKHAVTGPGGQPGNDSDSSATGSHPIAGSSDKPLPGPANPSLEPLFGRLVDTEGSHERGSRLLRSGRCGNHVVGGRRNSRAVEVVGAWRWSVSGARPRTHGGRRK
jgi:hypothetical protein